ncbi:hypothetical protein [[Pantoea] beijingensis]|nr:hypothetical protein [[Pantoea] beijingensis]
MASQNAAVLQQQQPASRRIYAEPQPGDRHYASLPAGSRIHPQFQQERAGVAAENVFPRIPNPPPESKNSLWARFNQMSLHRRQDKVEFDNRGNDAAATQRESSWSVNVLRSIHPDLATNFLQHIASLITGPLTATTEFKQKFKASLESRNISPTDVAALMTGFEHAETLKQSIQDGVIRNETPTALILRLVESNDFKIMLDLNGMLLEARDPETRRAIRRQPLFRDRGRIDVPKERVRSQSVYNRHAGIADELHRRPSTENFFNRNINHAKSSNMRDPLSETAKQFSKSGTPFIAGASGTMQVILHHMEQEKPYASLTAKERQSVETNILIHTALLVASGHHSIVEVLQPGRKLGYFSDLPDPLQGKKGYRNFMRALDSRLAALNLSAATRLGV